MAAGLGYIEFATGDILTASVANGYLASQTVMVFADAAARTSAIASPQEGMMSYLKDTNAVQYYSGSAWVAVGSAADGNGLTLISATSCSGVASQAVTGFSSTYQNYRILVVGDGTANDYVNIKLRSGATDASSTYYGYTNRFFSSNATQTYAQSNTSSLEIAQSYQACTSVIDVLRPFEAKRTAFNATGTQYDPGAGRSVTETTQGVHNVETSYDGFNIIWASGAFTGTIYLYGYQKA